MSDVKWSDADIDRCLRALSIEDVMPETPTVTPALRTRTLARLHRKRLPGRWKGVAAAAAAVFVLLAYGSQSSWAGVTEVILGIPVRVLNLSREEWLRGAFSHWLAMGPETEFFSPEETRELAPFPIRTPTWVPEGFAARHEPMGAYPWGHYPDEGWQRIEQDEFFFVTQTYASDEGQHVSIIQSLRRETPQLDLPPGTEIIEVAGHPAFLERDVPVARADEENEARSRLGLLPEIVGHWNTLELWVQEADGQTTSIKLSGDVSPEILIKVAESMF